jgi:hypothetical protein
MEIGLNASEVLHSQIQFEPGFAAVHLLHPATYLNKVLVGGSDGSLQLWNIRTRYVLWCTFRSDSTNFFALAPAYTKYPSLASQNRLVTRSHP